MKKIKIVTIEEIEEEEDLWRTIHEMLTLAEKIVISKMGEFNDVNMNSLLKIKKLISVARLEALDKWKTVNYAVKYSETKTVDDQS